MSDPAPLLAAIRAAPDDDAPRLVYADWLDEHGQPERAEFIRVQVELARHNSPALRRREAELLAAYHDNFAGPLAAPHLRFRFERGFVLGFGHTGVFENRNLWGANHAYRFFPDGCYVSGYVDRATLEQLHPASSQAQERLWGGGTYFMDPFTVPITLELTELIGQGKTDQYQAKLEDMGLQVNRRVWEDGHRDWERYPLRLVDGLTSFPET